MGSMHTGLEDHLRDFPKLAAYFAERARGKVGLIVTGGFAPNRSGWLVPMGSKLTNRREVRAHQQVTNAVHEENGKICLQILHAGRYGYHPFIVAPSAVKSPISPFKPRALSKRGVQKQIKDFIRCASLAQEAGYDGVEVMGSEGYFINQFLVEHVNKRKDQWGGSFKNRMSLPVEIVRGIREAVGKKFIIIYRLSMLDLVPKGSNWDEVIILAKAIEEAGATIINTGIGWHEARIPTIATIVPRAGFTWVTQKLKGEVRIPLVATNRINNPDVAENILARGDADMVSMARPLLADADFVLKTEEGRTDEIQICIACNQACLDHVFSGKKATCLVNPRACHETDLNYVPTKNKKIIAIVGAGPAGLAFSTIAAERGHEVHLYDAASEIGGQFNMAKQIPGKEEFYETIRYYQRQLELKKVHLHLNQTMTSDTLIQGKFDEVVLATGVTPRIPEIDGINHPKVLLYTDVLMHKKPVGKSVAIIGAGGIGFDVAAYIIHGNSSEVPDISNFLSEWGIDSTIQARGGVEGIKPQVDASPVKVYLLQRKTGKLGKKMGKTTGWIHRTILKQKKVEMISGAVYEKIDDEGLHISVDGTQKILNVDHVVVCAGQESKTDLLAGLQTASVKTHLIGGAKLARELDAKRAIDEGCRLAASI